MKVTIARASDRSNEKQMNLTWAGQFADELLNLNKEIPKPENVNTFENDDDEEFSYIVTVNKKTRAVEIMIYDYYVE